MEKHHKIHVHEASEEGGEALPGAASKTEAERSESEHGEAVGAEEAGGEDPLAAARAEAAEHYDKYIRARAELENVLKRHERDRDERAKYAVEPLARDLLAVVDDLERAREHAGVDDGGLADGVRLVLKGLAEVMAGHGIERIKSVGLPFDPGSHEAVAMIETDRVPPNHVVEEQRAGYRLKDRLLRPAMVVVSKARSDTEASD